MKNFWFWFLVICSLIWGITLGCAMIYGAPAPFQRHPEADPNEISPGVYRLLYASLPEVDITFSSDGTYKHFLVYPESTCNEGTETPIWVFKYYTGKWTWNKETRIFVMNDLSLNNLKTDARYVFKMHPDKLDSTSAYVPISLRRKR